MLDFYASRENLSGVPVINTAQQPATHQQVQKDILDSKAELVFTDGRNHVPFNVAIHSFPYAYRINSYTWANHAFSQSPLNGREVLPRMVIHSNPETFTSSFEYHDLCTIQLSESGF
jgi:hypothetical protein